MLKNKLSSSNAQPILFIGVGGCGCNILTYLATRLEGEYVPVAMNDDALSLRKLESVPNHVLLTKTKLSEGDARLLEAMAKQAQTACIFLGIGGRTGSKVSIDILEKLKSLGLICAVVAVTPFNFESRMAIVKETLQNLSIADALVTISNQQLVEMAQPNQSMADAFEGLNKQILSLFQ